jgi:5-(carboxyamino)imidazole ribonucleotide synthase
MKVGIIGAGQLGQMLGIAGTRLGLEFVFLDPAREPPASTIGSVLCFPFDSGEGLRKLASSVDVITYEFENVPVESLKKISDGIQIYPPADALYHAQDRMREKELFETLAIPVPAYAAIDSEEDLNNAADSIGLPLILKTRRLGYDGKGQSIIRDESDIGVACKALRGRSFIAERWIDFDREISAIGARNVDGDIRLYPITENRHSEGILRVSRAPDSATNIAKLARHYLTIMLQRLNYVGVLTMEFFVQGDRLLANEFAPRVHNSGHWTIEGAETSQFENHLRAILNMPLGDTTGIAHAGMINLIGSMPTASFGPGRCYLHDYGKKPRPGRKLGHITLLADSAAERDRELDKIREKLAA